MSKPTITVEMTMREPKKHSVRYDGVGEEPFVKALYVMNQGINELGAPVPKRIRLTIERIE